MMRLLGAALLCSVALANASCASSHGSAATSAGDGSSHSDALISATEIQDSHQPTLFDVVRALRPSWLRQAPTAVSTGDDGIAVYLDEQRAGGIDVLRQLPSTAASSLRFFTPSEAQSRFGLGNLHGVIQITSARGRSSD